MDDRTSIHIQLNEEKRARIEAALKADPFRSDRVIAIETRTSQPSTYRVRKKLEQDGIIKPVALGHRRWTNRQDYLERVTKIIAEELKKDFKRSDRSLAVMLGVSPHSVKKVRAQLEHAGDIAPVEVKDRAKKHPVSPAGSRVKVPQGMTLEQLVRSGMKMEKEEGIKAEEACRRIHMNHSTYRQARSILILKDRTDLGDYESKTVQAAVDGMNEQNQINVFYKSIVPILDKIWGQRKGRRFDKQTERKKINAFNHAIDFISDLCAKSTDIRIPRLSEEEVDSVKERIAQAITNLRQFKGKLRR